MCLTSEGFINGQCLLARSILQPVLKRQPVVLDILFLLGRYKQDNGTGLNLNAIYKQLVAKGFSRNKSPVIMCINDLEQSELLASTKRGKQKEIKTLTPLGHEFVKLANDFDQYVKSCSELQEAIKHNFGVAKYSDKKVQRNVLRKEGWTAEEIDLSEELLSSSEQLTHLISPPEVISVMLIRYISVLLKINDNENARAILNRIIMDRISDQLSKTMVADAEHKESNHTVGIYRFPYPSLTGQKIDFVSKLMSRYYFSRFIDTEVWNVLSSLLNVLLVKVNDHWLKIEMNSLQSDVPGKNRLNKFKRSLSD
jgi:hypothetical protein